MYKGLSTNWPVYRSAAYCIGKGIHYGSGEGRIFHKRANDHNKFVITVDPRKTTQHCEKCGQGWIDAEVCGLDFADLRDKNFNWVFFGPLLVEHPDPKKLINESVKKLKGEGHLLFLVPKNFLGKLLDLLGPKWYFKEKIEDRDDYAFVVVKRTFTTKSQPSEVEKRVCVVRYGAYGDQIMITPLLRRLKEEGYHVTLNTDANSGVVLHHNPHIDNFVYQEREFVFNPELGKYWEEWSQQYDKYINLSESIERGLLKVEHHRDYYSPKEWRHKNCNVNYYDHTMKVAGYPDLVGTLPELYFTEKEQKEAQRIIRELAKEGLKYTVLWALKGSSYHKVYPAAKVAARVFLQKHKDAVVLLTGGPNAEEWIWQDERVISLVGKTPIRISLALTKYVNTVIGPETGLLNGASAFDTPKVCLLSHSTKENISKYWKNDYSLEPEQAPCWPCHQLHYSKESCPQAELIDQKSQQLLTIQPVCSVALSPETVANRLSQIRQECYN